MGKVIAGDSVIVSGVLKTEANDERDKKAQGIYTPYVLVNKLVILDGREKLEISKRELIKEMTGDPKIFYALVRSFCPAIYGHELVKAGLLLGLLGGSSSDMFDEEVSYRSACHVLLLGDPGLGKSQLLKYAIQLVPKSRYVCATNMSHAGLTVTVNREAEGLTTLSAGALVLSDGGICAIDEFDKTSELASLLEVMEQQTLTIAKAGILTQLKCKATIFASANPIHGSYNHGKTFKENTKISNAILSRFDLIFLLVDTPDPERDRKLSEHIMKVQSDNRKRPQKQRIY